MIEKLKFKKSSSNNNFSKTNNIDTWYNENEHNHLYSEIFTNLSNNINNLSPSSSLSVYFIDPNKSSISIKEANISSFEKKISLDNDILKDIQKSKKEKNFKKK